MSELLWGMARQEAGDEDDDGDDQQRRLGLWSLPTEVVVHALSFLANPRDLCSVSLTCRALAAISRADALWKPLGHPSWADLHVTEEGGWKAAYMKWLRAAITLKRPAAALAEPERRVTPTNNDDDDDDAVKVVVIGLPGVGKVSVLRRYTRSTSAHSPPPAAATTTGRAWLDFDIRLSRTRFSSANLSFCQATKGVLVVYDITDVPSFDATTVILQDIRKYAPEDVSVVLVGNKTDLAPEKRLVTESMGRRRAKEWGVLFCECSATASEGVDAFLLLVAAVQTSWQRPAGMATPNHVPSEALLAQLFPPPPVIAVAQPSGSIAEAQQWCVLQ